MKKWKRKTRDMKKLKRSTSKSPVKSADIGPNDAWIDNLKNSMNSDDSTP